MSDKLLYHGLGVWGYRVKNLVFQDGRYELVG